MRNIQTIEVRRQKSEVRSKILSFGLWALGFGLLAFCLLLVAGYWLPITDVYASSGKSQQVGDFISRKISFVNSIGREPNVVFPRVITPNNDGINDEVFFFFKNETDSPVQGAIYDLKSAKVVDLQLSAVYSGLHTLLVWNGRDESGAVVNSGVYVYKVEIGSVYYTGTVAVLR